MDWKLDPKKAGMRVRYHTRLLETRPLALAEDTEDAMSEDGLLSLQRVGCGRMHGLGVQ